MKLLELSQEDIRQDIRGFQARLSEAGRKLAGLPLDASTWQARKKLRAQRQALEAEVFHVKGLIRIAEGALVTDARACLDKKGKSVLSEGRRTGKPTPPLVYIPTDTNFSDQFSGHTQHVDIIKKRR